MGICDLFRSRSESLEIRYHILSTNRPILLSVGVNDFAPTFGMLSPGFLSHKGIESAEFPRNQHARVFLHPITWTESRQMLQQTSCVHLTTQSPIIQAILWRMVPAAVTRALMATARILMKMVGNFPLDVKLLAHCSSFRIRK